jgi:hypothetical protein
MMRRVLLAVLVLVLPAIMHAQTPVDTLINMDHSSPSSPGTQITTTILSNGTIGSWGGWNNIVGSGSNLTVGAHNPSCALGTPISVGGTTYLPTSASQAISLNNSSSFTYMVGSIPSQSKISVAGCITFGGVPNTTNLMDMVRINGAKGGYAVLQLRSGNCINIETDGNGTQHSGCITPSGNQPTYWCTMLVDPTTSIAKARCYLPVSPFTQIGSEISVVMKSSSVYGNVTGIYMGNAEAGTASGTLNVFENMIFDLTNAAFPLGVGTLSNSQQAPAITSAGSSSGTVSSAFSYQITASNSPTSFNATGLPAGLTVNTSNGLISGTPTAVGSFSVTISATNASGTGSATLALTINASQQAAPVITSAGSASGTMGSALSYQITASNNPTSFSATGLPAGLTVNTSNGLISGTPAAAGSTNAAISATNAGGTGTATLTLTISSSGGGGSTNWSGIISPARATDWSQAGVVGGIPNRTTVCATLNAGATNAQIRSAAQSCPAGGVVFLSAGSYSMGGLDLTGVNNVTVRGAGADQTTIVLTGTTGCNLSTGTGICVGSSDNNWKGGPSNQANFSGPYAQGTTTITLSAVTNLRVGNPLILDQLDDDVNGCDTGGIMVSMATTTCTPTAPGISGPFSLEGNFGGPQRTAGGSRQQGQIVTVIGCGTTTPGAACTSTSVTISPGLYMPNWRASQAPQAWWATSPVTGVGIENLTLDGTAVNSGTGIQFKNASNSWVKGVRIIDTNRAHIQKEYANHITTADNYEFLTQNTQTQSYGDECYFGSNNLVINNIFHAVAGPVLLNGACMGDVIAYNFAINEYYTVSAGWNETASSIHTAGVALALYEGNVWNQVESDVFHGTHHFITKFRNYEQETQPACYSGGSSYATATYAPCNNNLSMRTMAFSRFYNFIGNVLGTTGVQHGYESGNPAIYTIGVGNSNGTVTVPGDPNVATTLMRWGNYDTFNAAVTFSSAEVPSALTGVQAPFSNPVPTSQLLPASFFLNARPSWWPAGKPWPAIGPDVTGGNVSGVSGHAYTIPAQDCYNSIGGLVNGSGPVLTFNASKCYPSSTATLPAPPTGLQAIVH